MYRSALILLLSSAQAGVSSSPPISLDAREISPPSLLSTLRASDFAEIYIIPPWISFAAAPTPSTVRLSGCKYYVGRHAWNGDRAEWADLAKALTGLKIEPAPNARRRQVYYGLVMGDEKGTIREIYLDHMDDPPGKLFALDGRRQVHIPVRLAGALFAFAARHPELAQGPAERCPTPKEPWPADYIDRDVSSNR